MIHKEGIKTIAFVGIVVAALNTVFAFVLDLHHLIELFLSLASIAIFAIVLWFFRNSHRNIIPDDNSVVSCVDGKVVAIEPINEPEYFNGSRMIQVSVFMSVFNIHKNWWPVSGEIMHYIHHNGFFRVAWHPKSSTENERSSVVVKMKNGKEIMLRQIAGAVAKRIVTYTAKGDVTVQGNEMGFIKFGSRIDLILPEEASIKVKIGQRTIGTQTVIATFDE